MKACQLSIDGVSQQGDFINVRPSTLLPAGRVHRLRCHGKTEDAVVVPLDAGWSDVGSWSALWEVNDKDDNGNSLKGDTFLHNTKNCYINTDDQLVAAIGVDNLVIVNTKDAVLVVQKDQVQDVKRVVEFLKKNAAANTAVTGKRIGPGGAAT